MRPLSCSSNFLLDKERMAENLQKRVSLLFYYIFYFPMEETFQPYYMLFCIFMGDSERYTCTMYLEIDFEASRDAWTFFF